jgi:hypothetical protein
MIKKLQTCKDQDVDYDNKIVLRKNNILGKVQPRKKQQQQQQ